MTNPNNNQNFNDEALRINRALKRENDKLKEAIQILTIDYVDVWNDDKIWQEVDTKLKKLGV
jgi:hypothetical protein